MAVSNQTFPNITAWPKAPAAATRLNFDAAPLARDYNRRPFLFRHTLNEHPALTMEALLDLALRLDPKHVRHHNAHVPVTADFMNAPDHHPPALPLAETLAHMDSAGSYVLIANPQTDPEFGRFFGELIDEVHAQVGAADPGFHELVAYIFVSSPGAITPYHLDREVNFLCQIRGNKVVHLFDPANRALLSEQELDKVMFQPHAPRPPYHEEMESTATLWQLTPGLGVHHPYLAPHWVENGNEVSVSLAVSYRTRATERQVRARSFNHVMRQLGIAPRPFGASPLADSVKASAYRVLEPVRPALSRVKRLVKR